MQPAPASDERFFRAAVAADVGDSAARWLLAEWLEERGDERAAGYRWMGRQRKFPCRTSRTWDWWNIRWQRKVMSTLLLPAMIDRAVFARLTGYLGHGPDFREYGSRRAAEEALCLA